MLSSALSFLPSSLTFGYAPASGSKTLRSVDQSADDIKRELDRSLKDACEDLITQATVASTAPLRPFLAQASTLLGSASGDGKRDLTTQEWATPEKVLAVHEAVLESMRVGIASWVGKLRTYLEDDKAVDVLIPPMQVGPQLSERLLEAVVDARSLLSSTLLQSSIIDVYRPFHELVRTEYDFAISEQVTSPVRLWDLLRSLSSAPAHAPTDRLKTGTSPAAAGST